MSLDPVFGYDPAPPESSANDEALYAELRGRYAAVMDEIERSGAKLRRSHIENGRLYLRGTVPQQSVRDRLEQIAAGISPDWQSQIVFDMYPGPPENPPR